MKKRIALIIGLVIVIFIIVIAMLSGEKTPAPEIEKSKETPEAQEQDEQTSQQVEIPAEFQDNLDQAFEDLDVIQP